MTVRAVVLPATPLLVPGAAGQVEVLAPVRDVVLDALRRAVPRARTAGRAVRWGVLADAPTTRRGARRPSLAAVGIADRWVPVLATAAAAVPDGTATAGVAGSVGLWAVAATAGPGVGPDVEVVELAADAGTDEERAAVEALTAVDVLVVAVSGYGAGEAGAPGPCGPVDRVLDAVARRHGWTAHRTEVAVEGPHLPSSYAVDVLSDGPGPAG